MLCNNVHQTRINVGETCRTETISAAARRRRDGGQGVGIADGSATLVTLHINPLMLTLNRKRPGERRKYATNV